jgi:Zn-dependent protease
MIITILVIIVLLFSAIIHEYAHGYAAWLLGDDTAKDAGRLTMNPMAHLDPIGSVLLPLLLVLSKVNFFFAWAKPVPYNPYNLRDQKYGDLKVALAGPGSNLLIAIFFGLLARFVPLANGQKIVIIEAFFAGDSQNWLGLLHGSLFSGIFAFAVIIVFINLSLMFFNLLPVPPLDGSKVVYTFLPYHLKEKWLRFETFSLPLLLFLSFFGFLSFLFYFTFYTFGFLVGL